VYPDGSDRLVSFSRDPWPSWRFRILEDQFLEQELFVSRATCDTVLRWRVDGAPPGLRLTLRLLLSGRDSHALHRENPAFAFGGAVRGGNVAWRPYPDVPAVAVLTNGRFEAVPVWYRNFLYVAERDRGLDDREDLASPGLLAWDLGSGDAVLILRAGDGVNACAAATATMLANAERSRRASLGSPFARA